MSALTRLTDDDKDRARRGIAAARAALHQTDPDRDAIRRHQQAMAGLANATRSTQP
jgi:hypothetical protein